MAPLRCVYTDLDGTLLGYRGSLFRDPEGNFSLLQARALEACHRAEVEVVIKSGRREAQVLEDARLIGQSAYIYEAGCGIVIDGEKTLLTGEMQPQGEKTVADQIVEAGVPDLLFDHFSGRLEWHSPWHRDRKLSLLFRGHVDAAESNSVLQGSGHGHLRFLDNGAIARPMEGIPGPAHAYHLVPAEASKSRAVAFHQGARGYAPEECIAIGDSTEDLGVAEVVSRFFVPANGPERDPGLREAIADRDNVTVTEGRMGEGVYEAIVGSLAKRRGQ
jgi:hydroxymethylpyrimidine pyrophosphatase-like HAD family hydrolase